jgi:hypothetical protein
MDESLLPLRRAAGLSAAAERERRRGGAPRSQREAAAAASAVPLPSQEATRAFLASLRAGQRLGSGAHGSVFAGIWRERPVALKCVCHAPSRSLPPASALREFRLNRDFAAHGLAWAPLFLKGRRAAEGKGLSAKPEASLERNTAVLGLRLVPETLGQALRRDPAALGRAELARSLQRLLEDALSAGLAHNDAKCNNLGLERLSAQGGGSGGADLRFIDFGRSFSLEDLVGLPPSEARRALRLATARDALRLAASCRRALCRRGGGGEEDDVAAHLEAYAKTLLEPGDAVELGALGTPLKRLLARAFAREEAAALTEAPPSRPIGCP